MRDAVRRPAAAAIVLAIVVISIGAAQPPTTTGHAIPGFERFLYALGQVESGGRYNARNRSSGAYGKYQIIPSSWRAWSRQVLGNPNAQKTPANQEKVARFKIHQAWHRTQRWRVVAYGWLTGWLVRNERAWSPFARSYVNKVMKVYTSGKGGPPIDAPVTVAPSPPTTPPETPPATPPETPPTPPETQPATPPETQSATPPETPPETVAQAPPPPPPPPQLLRYPETHQEIAWAGAWKAANHPSYGGNSVRWSRQAGASATLSFEGTSVAWIGPKGPTRGVAKVYVDGAFVRKVDLRAATFRPRSTIFSTSGLTSGGHTLLIQVVGTRGRPTVAIDELRVVR